ncbi:hypothetical protein SDC9_127634 [bioreactor metagenome]|uniref:Uncharacterized protein n=1 Tax=bioreactor metagenome TaxID=1076179 RepID=A0A645CUL8_9ZZZZ
MNAFNLNSIWGIFLLLIFFYVYDKFLKKTSFRKLGKPISLLIFALNLMDKKTWGEVK